MSTSWCVLLFCVHVFNCCANDDTTSWWMMNVLCSEHYSHNFKVGQLGQAHNTDIFSAVQSLNHPTINNLFYVMFEFFCHVVLYFVSIFFFFCLFLFACILYFLLHFFEEVVLSTFLADSTDKCELKVFNGGRVFVLYSTFEPILVCLDNMWADVCSVCWWWWWCCICISILLLGATKFIAITSRDHLM